MTNIESIFRNLQIQDTEANREIILSITREYENNLGGVSIDLQDGQKYLLDFIRNHSRFADIKEEDNAELRLGY